MSRRQKAQRVYGTAVRPENPPLILAQRTTGKTVVCHACGKTIFTSGSRSVRIPGVGTKPFCRQGCAP